MRDTFDITDIVFMELKKSAAIQNAINGGIYKYARPVNSSKQDIVIKPLPVVNAQLQRSVVNVNVHVPNLKLKIGNTQDNSQPDSVKLKTLTSLVIDQLKDKAFEDHYIDIQQQNVMRDETANEHFSNIRVNFFSENI